MKNRYKILYLFHTKNIPIYTKYVTYRDKIGDIQRQDR